MTTISEREHLKQTALAIYSEALAAVEPCSAVHRCLSLIEDQTLVLQVPGGAQQKLDLSLYDNVVVVGAGKATARMCQAVEGILADRVSGGLIVVKEGHAVATSRVEVVEASHPLPDARGMAGAREILARLDRLGAQSLVLLLLSGGGSALLAAPAEGIELCDKQRLTELLLAAGADIAEINAVRKHVSAIKGGQLARHAYPATVVTLLLSDVVGDRPDVIASGPAAPDPSTFAEARGVLERYQLWGQTPAPIRRRIEAGLAGQVPETPKASDPIFAGSQQVIIGSNRVALEAARGAATQRGFNTLLLSDSIEGETREIARMHAAMCREIRRTGHPIPPPACLVSGGETTVTLKGRGKGGRNQEFALAAALDIAATFGVVVFSAGTDGTDGPTDAAGAIAFGDSLQRAAQAGLDARAALENNDAYPLFEQLGDLIVTGPTGTNVMDLHLVLVLDPR